MKSKMVHFTIFHYILIVIFNEVMQTFKTCYQFIFTFKSQICFNKTKTKIPYVYICIFHHLD